jgi:predicted phage terminase large subunit-like protein
MRLPELHRDLHEFLDDSARGLVELPRDHGKTVQVMIRILWELGHNPNLRVLLVCGSNMLAGQRGRFLRDAIAENPRLRLVFPHLIPDQPWRANMFRIRRSGTSVSPTVVVVGIGATSTGSRADLLVCDDIVDVKSLRSNTIREKTKEVYRENLVHLLEPNGRAWLLFTPWHAADINAEMKECELYRHFRRAVGDNLEPIWPEKWPSRRLAERRKEIGESSFARAFRLQTIAAEDCLIKPEWVRFWEGGLISRSEMATMGRSEMATIEMVVLAVDPAVSQKQSADATAIVALARMSDGRVHCLEAIARRVSTPQMVQLLDDADRRWKPDIILFEANAAFKGVKDLMVSFRNWGAKIKEIRQTSDKFARIQSFSVRVENGAFLLRGEGGRVNPGQQELLDEMLAFPVGKHDDLVDAAAFGSAFLLDRPEPRVWTF